MAGRLVERRGGLTRNRARRGEVRGVGVGKMALRAMELKRMGVGGRWGEGGGGMLEQVYEAKDG